MPQTLIQIQSSKAHKFQQSVILFFPFGPEPKPLTVNKIKYHNDYLIKIHKLKSEWRTNVYAFHPI